MYFWGWVCHGDARAHSTERRVVYRQGDQIGQNFAIWAEFFSRKNSPMIWAKF